MRLFSRQNYYKTLIFGALLLISGLLRADYEDGVNAAFDGDFDLAYEEFSVAAEQGLDLAQYNLAILYFTGRGVDQNMEQAFRWTKAAAEQGHLDAQANLASLYIDGNGVDKDVAGGLEWFASAGKAGHAGAAFSLANIYLDGDLTDRDLVQAHAWANQAVRNEHAEAEALVVQIQQQLDDQQLSQARRLFARWQIE